MGSIGAMGRWAIVVLVLALAACADGSSGAPEGGTGGVGGGSAAVIAGTGGAGGVPDHCACDGPGGTYTETDTLLFAANCIGMSEVGVHTVMAAAAPTACHPLPIAECQCVTVYDYPAIGQTGGSCAAARGTVVWNATGSHGEGDVTLSYLCGDIVFHVAYDRQ